MTTLDDLLMIDGVMLAVEFMPDGRLVSYRTNAGVSKELAATTAQFCATVTMMFSTLSTAFSELSRMKWLPQHGWIYSGGDWTVAIGNNKGLFIETARADFNQLYESLSGVRLTRVC
jgi:roadblock/LC7 domain-containing protein